MVIRVIAVPDSLDLRESNEIFRAVLGWDNIGGSVANGVGFDLIR